MRKHTLLLKLGTAETICVWTRDLVFDGSWEKMLKFIRERGSASQKKDDVPIIKRLLAYEKKYGVNISEMVEKQGAVGGKSLKPLDAKKLKLMNEMLSVCQHSGLSPRTVKNVLEVLLHLIGKQIATTRCDAHYI